MPFIKYLLFDLDNTLYPASSGLSEQMDRLMTEWVANYLSVDLQLADSLRYRGYLQYGTTLQWLRQEKGLVDLQPYLAAVHPNNLGDYLRPAPELRQVLQQINCPKAVLTNSPLSHAQGVLQVLGLSDIFETIFDLSYNQYLGKPYESTYQKALKHIGHQADNVLFFDDSQSYLQGFAKIGGHCVWVNESNTESAVLNSNFSIIQSLHQIQTLLGCDNQGNLVYTCRKPE